MYGWRGRIGVVFPSRGDTFTYEFYKMVPEGIVLVSTCLKIYELTKEQLSEAMRQYDDAAQDLAQVGVDVMVLTGTPPFRLKGVGSDRAAIERVQKTTNIPTTTGITSEIEALKHLNVTKLVVATPFTEEVNERGKTFLEAHDFTVLEMKGLGIQRNSEIASLPLYAPYKLAKELFLKHPDCEGIYIQCPRWATAGIIDKLEKDLRVPVVTCVQASLWNALRILNIKEPISGYGRLLENE